MKILIEGDNLSDYLAKCHEAFRHGLRSSFDARCFGRGYPGYDPSLTSYPEIASRLFPDGPPDLIIADPDTEEALLCQKWRYAGMRELPSRRALILGDFWRLEKRKEEFAGHLVRNGVSCVLSLFPQPLSIWGDTEAAGRFVYLPPCFDPALFNDWQMPKTYDVGFLAASALEYDPFYPERYEIHQRLLHSNLNYLWAQHPGWERRQEPHPLVGRNFSRAINSCKIFVTSGGVLRNPQPKIFEALASRTLLMSDEPVGAELLGLVDGVNYVRITPADLLEKVSYYLAHDDERESIAEEGYRLALREHSCFARAAQFYQKISPLLGGGREEPEGAERGPSTRPSPAADGCNLSLRSLTSRLKWRLHRLIG